MKILNIKTIYGPNVYHQLPIVLMTLQLEEWTNIPSSNIPKFIENLKSILPGLKQHQCSKGYPGGFIERLYTGTYMAHIVEHIAIELSVLAKIGVDFGKTRYAGESGKYEIATRFANEFGMTECLKHAVDLSQAAAGSKEFNLNAIIEKICREVERTSFGPSTQILIETAKKRNIPVRRAGDNSLLYLGYGKHGKKIQSTITDLTSLVAADIAQDKKWTKTILEENFIPVPQGVTVNTEKELLTALSLIKTPCVLKPFNGHHGNGVALNLETIEEILKSFNIAKKYSDSVLLEEMCYGKDYRVLVVNGKMVAAAERVPPSIIGDGIKNISELIGLTNSNPLRGNGHENVLSKIEADEIVMSCLSKQGLALDSVIAKDHKVFLRENANLSSGGTALDVTDLVHDEIKNLCERITRVVGLDICGIDLIHEDISKPAGESLKIIEVNAGPGLRMHIAPSEGKARNVAEPIFDMLYPNSSTGRIPIISVTGTNGKTTVVRMIHKIFSEVPGQCVGLTTTDGIWIGPDKVFSGDTTGPQSSRMILSDPKVDFAVLEVARGGLLRAGLAYDWSDVSVITNIRPDHIGQDGIEDVDDLIWIKSVVAERVKENGYLVLNADDEASLSLKNHPRVNKKPKNYFLFSMDEKNYNFIKHRISGQSACWIENEWIHVQHHGIWKRLMKVSDIPATLNGIAEFQIANALAAICAALAGGATYAQIESGLRSFHPFTENRGRLNLYKIRNSHVIVDYGHNPDAIMAMGKVLDRFPDCKKTAVFSLPGDRCDELIFKGGEVVASYFNKFVLKDDTDRRGRAPGKTPKIIEAAILSINPKAEIEIHVDETKAVEAALKNMEKHEIISIFYENFDKVMPLLLQYDPEPVNGIHESPRLFNDLNGEIVSHDSYQFRVL